MTYQYKLDDEGREAAAAVVKEWTDIAFRTGPMSEDEQEQCKLAARGLYEAAGLTPPPLERIVIAPSPFVARFAAGAAAWVWYSADSATVSATRIATDSATRIATDSATGRATRIATDSATDSATGIATYIATYIATVSATDSATGIATYIATDSATDSATGSDWLSGCVSSVFKTAGVGSIECAKKAWRFYQGGSSWAATCAFVDFGRDHAKLGEKGVVSPDLYEKYAHWEVLARLSGFRFMHEKFCIISDRPLFYRLNSNNDFHSDDGPAVQWSDGSCIHAWNGTVMPAVWFTDGDPDVKTILSHRNVEERAAGLQYIGLANVLDELDHRIIDSDPDPLRGDLIGVKLPGLETEGRYLKAHCPRNGTIMEAVPPISDIDGKPIDTVIAAQAWRVRLTPEEFQYPSVRT